MNASLGMGLLWFVVVLAAIPVALWLLKRTPYGAALSGGVGGAAVRTVSSTALGPHQRLVTVELGQGDERRWLVLGVTPQSITPLHTLTPSLPEPATGGSAQASGALSFATILSKLKNTKAGDARG